ncbi:hypothetical protein N7532_006416 [Penicillium argentinense]|uniref:SMP-30/Gluconolactonase/LRE-like region domain-containing protein n=1 Tax=Penicillium argentinense TaxID=1131581 RepID=A0A9W9FG14_9EURO|nr:uncharacterized protein N7532_006416 [Penicillium argentinense]KAJ5099415.1 hypothetical protein N7532_006416 [Penicillium argentinense]
MRLNQALVILPVATYALAQSTTKLFNFTSDIDIENSATRPNGNLLLTTFEKGRLYQLNPLQHAPQAELVAALPGATALCGIAPIDLDKFAVIGGVRGHYSYVNETVYTVDFSQNPTKPTIQTISRIPEAVMLNGLASMPSQPHVVLIGDARRGAIFRVDTATGSSQVTFKDEALTAPANASIPIGINGLKVFGNNVFFTNSARNIFAKIPVSDDGLTFGSVQIIAHLETRKSGEDWDDFIIDTDGIAYVAQPNNSLARITLDGEISVIAGGGNSTILARPTSVQISKDGKSLYVMTGAGSIVEVKIPRD